MKTKEQILEEIDRIGKVILELESKEQCSEFSYLKTVNMICRDTLLWVLSE